MVNQLRKFDMHGTPCANGHYCNAGEAEDLINSLHEEILSLRQEVERLRNPWISVDDELPEPDELCLVYFGDPEIDPEFDYMDTEVDFGTQFWANHGDDVTHWIPSPQPPKESKDA